jgi:glycopeptide antibiotics resistance protein
MKRAATIIFAVSFGIETLQIVLSYFGLIFARSFNVDDLILNAVGGVLGYFVSKQLKKLYREIHSKKQSVNF